MLSSIAAYKENLSQIARDVPDAAEELETSRSSPGESASVSDRRTSHQFAQFKSPLRSSSQNGIDASFKMEGDGDQSNIRQQRRTSQGNTHPTGNHIHRGIDPKHDASSNGSEQATQNLLGHEKGPVDLFEEEKKNQFLAEVRAAHKLEIKQSREHLDNILADLASTNVQLEGEHLLSESSQKEINSLKVEKDRAFLEVKELRNDLEKKISEIRRLQSELNRRDMDEPAVTVEGMKSVMSALEMENANLKSEKDDLISTLKLCREHTPDVNNAAGSMASSKHLRNFIEVQSSENFLAKEDTALSQKWDQQLRDAFRERDKALQELTRLKQHLLEKELEESDKMDEDSKIIEELRANSELQQARILRLERDLKLAISNQEQVKKMNSNELEKAYEMINDLKHKLTVCMNTVDSKNIELFNLQTALGQYYAESEAKERLQADFAACREELAHHSGLLKDANQKLEVSKQEKDEVLAKFAKAERMLLDGQHMVQKLEEDNLKLRRALEHSMTRLDRMSLDSDYFVDRRIVIKLLVTYFQRNHSKEVLNLMVRMLGFSDEDKQRIGFAQQVASKGVVRGVLGLPGRLVGSILGGTTSSEVSARIPSENQSFTDLWVDFLLKETEERERRETAEAEGASWQAQGETGDLRIPSNTIGASSSPTMFLSIDNEFSTVPLTSSVSPSPEKSARLSRFLPRY